MPEPAAGRRGGRLTPNRLMPRPNMTRPRTSTSTPLALSMRALNLALSRELTRPKPSMSGTVPRLKRNMDSAPANRLPVPSAYTCMVCRGPQGMRPLSRPTTNGPLPEAAVDSLRPAKPGRRTFRRESQGKIPSIRTPRKSMKAPASTGITPLRAVERLNREPTAPTMPPMIV
jgi:hypothetical protein